MCFSQLVEFPITQAFTRWQNRSIRLTAEEFEQAARATAYNKKIKDDETGAEAEVKYFINPTGIIEYFKKIG